MVASFYVVAVLTGAAVASAIWWSWALQLKSRNKVLERFRTAVDACGDSIYVTDRKTMRFVDMSQSAIQRSGYSRDELVRMGPQDYVKGKDPSEVARAFDEVIAGSGAGHMSEQISTLKDGSRIYSENFRRAFNIDGNWLIVSSSRNITQRKTAELAFLRLSRILAALNATNEAIMRTPTPEDLFAAICDAAVNGGNFTAASVCLIDDNTSDARVSAVSGAGAEHVREMRFCVDETQPEGNGLVGTAFRSREPCISNDLVNDERTATWRARALALGVASGAAIPFRRKDQGCGVLLLYSSELHAFDTETVELLRRMARNVSFALDHYDLEVERNRAEQQLRRTEGRLNRVTRGTNDGLWEQDVRTGEIWYSPRFAQILDYTTDELRARGRQLTELVHIEDRPAFSHTL